MKKALSVILGMILCWGALAQQTLDIKVTGVIDGDTLKAEIPRSSR